MPTNPMAEVWRRLDREPPVFFDEQLGPALGGARDQVLAMGLLRAAPPSNSGTCPGCPAGFVGRVEWLDRRRTGGRAPFVRCTTCGPVEIAPDSLRCWALDVAALLAAFRTAAQLRGEVTEAVPGRLWHLGRAALRGRSREAYLARCVYEGNRSGVASALTTHPRAVLFFPTESAAHRWSGATPNPVLALESVVGLGAGGFTFDASLVGDRLADVDFGAPGAGPTPKRATRLANIARLTEEVIEHLRRARAHAFATHELSKGRAAELLERPTKKKLGELVGLEPDAVTRCFGDESARELNLYWEMALDLDAVMKFQGPISTGPGD
jgi:hypothetical protein